MSGYEQEAYGGSKADYYTDLAAGGTGFGSTGLQGYDLVKQRELESAAAYEAQKRKEAADAAAKAAEQRMITDAYQQYSNLLQEGGMFNLSGTPGGEVARNAFDVTPLSEQQLIDKASFANQYQSFRDTFGAEFDPEDVIPLVGNVSGEFAGGDYTGKIAYDIPDDFGAFAFNLFVPQTVSTLGGVLAGEGAYELLGTDPKTAATGAMFTEAGLKGVLSASKKANRVQLDDGTIGYISNIPGSKGFTSEAAVIERNKAKALEMLNQPEDDAGRQVTANTIAESLGQGLSLTAQTGQRKPDWTDYYKPSFSIDPEQIVTDFLSGQLKAADLKSLQFAGRLGSGEDFVEAAFNVYGDSINELLPEGYEKPTQAAIRIGLGENRVKVLGDVYGEDFNLDTPMGQAGLKGAETFDMTGDGEKALQDAVYTYFKEGGKIPSMEGKMPKLADFEVPKWLPEGIPLEVGSFDWWEEAGFSFKDLAEIPDMKVNIPKMDFGGRSLTEIEGLNLGNLDEFGLEIGDLPSLNIDFDLDLLGLTLAEQQFQKGRLPEDDEEFESLEEDEELFDPTRSLAREMLGMEQRREVREAQERA